MADINRVVISGRLTRDPELKSIASSQTSVLSFSLAVNDRRRNQQTQQWEDYANFIDCTMFGARAESLSHILTKGTLVCVEGKLRWSSWERDGQRRSKIEVIADEVVLPSRSQGGAQVGSGYQGANPAPQQQPQPLPTQNTYTAMPAQVPNSYQGGYQVQQPAPMPGTAQQPPMDQTYDDEIPF